MQLFSHASLSHSRQASAIVIAMGAILVVSTAMLIAVSQVSNRTTRIDSEIRQQQAFGALQAILAKRELHIIDLAETGDAELFGNWPSNYGEDYFAGFKVRWKIEPAVVTALAKDSLGQLPYITNPAPFSSASLAPNNKVSNGYVFIYRVSGEAQDVSEWSHGIRHHTIPRVLQFKVPGMWSYRSDQCLEMYYFMPRKDPLGDLELTHSNTLNIQG